MLPKTVLDPILRQALAEDIGSGDVTAMLVAAGTLARARIVTREHAVLCGQPWVSEVFRQIDPRVRVEWLCGDGQTVKADEILLEIEGPARSLLTGERTALNFLQLLSGTATRCHRYAGLVAGLPVQAPVGRADHVVGRRARADKPPVHYAPLRTVEPLPGVMRINLRRDMDLGTLMPTLPVRALALASWRLEDQWVTAVRLTNTSAGWVTLDPRVLQGDFLTATFQHEALGPHGVPEDTTVLYLVTRGHGLAQSLLPAIHRFDPAVHLPQPEAEATERKEADHAQ